jgi:hypothetical protein
MSLLILLILLLSLFPFIRYLRMSYKWRHLPGCAWWTSFPVIGHAYMFGLYENPAKALIEFRKKSVSIQLHYLSLFL